MKKAIYFLLLLMVSVGASAQNKASKNDEAQTVVEEMPSFPGGEGALFTYLSQNMKYPAIAQENGIQGLVIVRFVVQKDGSIGTVEILRSLDRACDNEAIRLVKSMPQWSPGKQNGAPVSVWYTLPFKFRLEGGSDQNKNKPATMATNTSSVNTASLTRQVAQTNAISVPQQASSQVSARNQNDRIATTKTSTTNTVNATRKVAQTRTIAIPQQVSSQVMVNEQSEQNKVTNNGPSITETQEWIQTKISMWGTEFIKHSKFEKSCLLITNSSWRKKETGESGVYGYVKVVPQLIKSISTKRYDNSNYGIIISGEYKWEYYKGKYFGQDMSGFSINYEDEFPSVSLSLDESTSETDVNKLVKALKYWATSCGAKLVNDDLF